ncbi:MAG: clostripain-related cysteine peptidase [Rikenellaceae bacterium]
MKHGILYFIAVISILISSCQKEEDNIASSTTPDTTPQTTLMYMTGTDLSSFFSSNITAAKKAIVTDALGYGRFLIFRHSTSSTATLVEYAYEDGSCTETTLEEYTNITSLSQDAITTVVADLKRHAPADTYNLIISGHATGWVPKTRQTSSWSSPAATSQSAIDWEAMNSSPVVTRYLGSTNDSFFDIEELQVSLEATDTHFGCIIFDECFMASIEALYDLRNTCDYIIASPCEIMGAGFPYDTVLPELFAENGTEPNLQGICQAYYDYYSTYTYPSGCVSMVVTEHLDALASITAQINASQTNTVDLSEMQAYERLSEHLFYDFEQYMLALSSDQSLSATFLETMEAAFPTDCRLYTERFFANIGTSASSSNNYEAYYTTINYYSGVTTSAPTSQMSTEWAETAWSSIVK